MILKRSVAAVLVLLAFSPVCRGASVADLERQVRASEQARISMQHQLEQMGSELNAVYGKLEEAGNSIRELQRNQQDLYRQIDELKSRLASATAAPPPAQPEPAKNSGSKPAPSAGNGKEAYQDAVNLIMVDKNYPAASKAFKDFLAKYPDSPFKSNAHFWLGESCMKQKNSTEAKQNFLLVVKDTGSNKRAEALYKLGVIEATSGDPDKAKKFFSLVLREYPGTATARLAQNELDRLK